MPEAKTLRPKPARLAALKNGYQLGREIARQQVAERGILKMVAFQIESDLVAMIRPTTNEYKTKDALWCKPSCRMHCITKQVCNASVRHGSCALPLTRRWC